MTELTASRTLVKSPPELWAECSDAASLARHLGQFGEIRITRLEPETAVAWEGERASGTVRLEPSGWGTRVVLTARPTSSETPGASPTLEPRAPTSEIEAPGEESGAELVVVEPPPRGFARVLAWFRGRRATVPVTEAPATPQPGPVLATDPEPALAPSPAPAAVAQTQLADEPLEPEPPEAAVLEQALESLGQAHHRPFSRA
jgi:hypothetical protein